jgi:hypothetical protein
MLSSQTIRIGALQRNRTGCHVYGEATTCPREAPVPCRRVSLRFITRLESTCGAQIGWTEACSWNAGQSVFRSFELRVLDFGLLQDRNVGVGVFPFGKKLLVSATATGDVASESA